MNARDLRPDTVLTMEELAAAIGSRRRDGSPTSAETCRKWCLHGRRGIKLDSWVEVQTRMTTWGRYVDFCRKVARAHDEVRRRRREAARAAIAPRRPGGATDARRRLEEMGAR